MKFSTAVAVLSILSLNGFASVAALPMYADYDLDVRGEAMDTQSEIWARYNDEKLELASGDAENKIVIATRDFMEVVVYPRMMEAARVAAKGTARVVSDLGTDALKEGGESAARVAGSHEVTDSERWQLEVAAVKDGIHPQKAPAPASSTPRLAMTQPVEPSGIAQEDQPAGWSEISPGSSRRPTAGTSEVLSKMGVPESSQPEPEVLPAVLDHMKTQE